jgi:hypothetical protein
VVVIAILLAIRMPAAAADEPVLEIDWSTTPPGSGTIVDGAAQVTAGPEGGTFPLVSLAPPDLGTVGYAIKGQVRYTDVAGQGYLEMWSTLVDGDRYFSRTLAADGAMAALTGSSGWRSFELPFFLQGAPSPERLEINVVLPGEGTVAVGKLSLVRLEGAVGTGWTTDQLAGLLGGVLGATVGTIGALIGWLISRRRARALVLRAMTLLAGLGMVFVAAAAAVALSGGWSGITYVLLLTGIVMASVFGLGLPGARRAYADAELRRMRAMDRG